MRTGNFYEVIHAVICSWWSNYYQYQWNIYSGNVSLNTYSVWITTCIEYNSVQHNYMHSDGYSRLRPSVYIATDIKKVKWRHRPSLPKFWPMSSHTWMKIKITKKYKTVNYLMRNNKYMTKKWFTPMMVCH